MRYVPLPISVSPLTRYLPSYYHQFLPSHDLSLLFSVQEPKDTREPIFVPTSGVL